MKLVVAEKPSVAQSLAAVLGAKEKKDGDLEGGGWLVSWCVGHLVELAQPEAYGEQYAKWRYADLPILPAHWKYDVAKDKKKQLGVLLRLMEDNGGASSTRWPTHQDTSQPLPSRYPSFFSFAPSTAAKDWATLGFSATTSFIRPNLLLYQRIL